MAKNVAIIGGGISGLALVHFLKKRFKDSLGITLYEGNPEGGGNIGSLHHSGYLFETGPNGFLHNELTLQLCYDLGLTDQLVQAAPKLIRYVCVRDQLLAVPTSAAAFLQTTLLPWPHKVRVLKGAFSKNISKDQSVYDYAVKRFGRHAAEKLVDPFISGIYAGDIKRLHMGAALSKMAKPAKGRSMYSLKEGMGQLVQRLARVYRAHIQYQSPVQTLEQLMADHVFCTAPAYAASRLVASHHPELAQALDTIPYVPVAVVGMGFPKSAFKKAPQGFGYVVPSGEGKKVLGVLIESNVYKGRAPAGMMMVRVLLGGRHNPDVVGEDAASLLKRAVDELNAVYGLNAPPVMHWVKAWPRAIPQYEMNYPQVRATIHAELNRLPNLTLVGNYLDGVAVNDCINNAKKIADTAQF